MPDTIEELDDSNMTQKNIQRLEDDRDALLKKRFWWEALKCCSFTFLLTFKPSEPHISTYLREVKHFTDVDIYTQIYPWWTYSTLVLVFVSAFLAEFVGYKLSLILGACGRVATRFLLLFGTELWHMQMMQVFYALGTTAEIVFYAYIFHIVTRDDYQKLTSMALAAHVISNALSGFLGDILLNAFNQSYTTLMWWSAVFVCCAALVSLTFTPVRRPKSPTPAQVWTTIRLAYRNLTFLLIILWWIFANAAYGIVYGYESSLYDIIMTRDKLDNYNGTVFAMGQILATITSLTVAVPIILRFTSKNQHFTVGLVGWFCTGALGVMAWWSNLAPMCTGFVLYYGSYHFINAFVSAETGRVVNSNTRTLQSSGDPGRDCYAMVVLCNNVVALVLSVLLNFIFFTWYALDLFLVYRILWAYQTAFTAIFSLGALGLYSWHRLQCSPQS